MTSKRHVKRKRRICLRKHKHATYWDAQAHVISQLAKSGEWLEPYRCRKCGFWHVGHRWGKVGSAGEFAQVKQEEATSGASSA